MDAEKIKKVVLKEEEKVTVQVNAATAIKDSCDAELAVAEPVLLKALKGRGTCVALFRGAVVDGSFCLFFVLFFLLFFFAFFRGFRGSRGSFERPDEK